MNINFTCPKCEEENSYFDGRAYTCPDCDYNWSISGTTTAINPLRNSNYQNLASLEKPFFKLEHGKLYDCKVEHDRGIESISIIPLAFEKGRNRQFVMIDARNLFAQNPDYVYNIIEMGFDYIMDDGIRADYPSGFEPVLCATQGDGTIIEYGNAVFFDFRITDEV